LYYITLHHIVTVKMYSIWHTGHGGVLLELVPRKDPRDRPCIRHVHIHRIHLVSARLHILYITQLNEYTFHVFYISLREDPRDRPCTRPARAPTPRQLSVAFVRPSVFICPCLSVGPSARVCPSVPPASQPIGLDHTSILRTQTGIGAYVRLRTCTHAAHIDA
jgi:hypothetical protein